MTIEEIKDLIKLANESGVAELEVQRGDDRVRIRRTAPMPQEFLVGQGYAGSAAGSPSETPATAVAAPNQPDPADSGKQKMLDEAHELVKSPIVGTYYDSSAPGAPPFVRVGDQVEPGQVLCIIESMKLMNEIEAEIGGTIVTKLVENGRPVEYGEALFGIRPR